MDIGVIYFRRSTLYLSWWESLIFNVKSWERVFLLYVSYTYINFTIWWVLPGIQGIQTVFRDVII